MCFVCFFTKIFILHLQLCYNKINESKWNIGYSLIRKVPQKRFANNPFPFTSVFACISTLRSR